MAGVFTTAEGGVIAVGGVGTGPGAVVVTPAGAAVAVYGVGVSQSAPNHLMNDPNIVRSNESPDKVDNVKKKNEDIYENPGHHDPNGGPNNYIPKKSVIPENHQQLWDDSILDNSGKHRWVKEGSGKKAVYHRFSNDGNGNWHYSGSSPGKTLSGGQTNLPKVPIEIKRL